MLTLIIAGNLGCQATQQERNQNQLEIERCDVISNGKIEILSTTNDK